MSNSKLDRLFNRLVVHIHKPGVSYLLDTAIHNPNYQGYEKKYNLCDIFRSEHDENGFYEWTGVRVTEATMIKYLEMTIDFIENDVQPKNKGERFLKFFEVVTKELIWLNPDD